MAEVHDFPQTPPSAVDAALLLASHGVYTFPTHTYLAGVGCSCRDLNCSNAGKHPIEAGWRERLTLDPDEIRAWFGRYPACNVAVAVGFNVIALDIDARYGGRIEDMTRWPATFRVRTQGAGWAALYAGGEGVPEVREKDGTLGAGVGLRTSPGKYQIVWGAGRQGSYQWLDAQAPTEVPGDLVEIVLDARVRKSRGFDVYETPSRVSGPTNYGRATLTTLCREVASAPQGARNNTLNDAAFRLGQLIETGHIEGAEARSALLGAAMVAFDVREQKEVRDTIARGIRDGALKPRGAAERPEYRAQAREPEASNSDALETVVRARDVKIEGVRWLWHLRVPLDLCVWYGPPGVGKGFTVADISARVTTGAPWPFDTDGECRDPRGVLVYAGEERPGKLVARYRAAGADIDRLAFYSRAALGRRLLLPADLELIRRDAKRLDAQLLVIDPINSFIDAKSTDAHSDVDVHEVLDVLVELAGELGVAVMLVSHVRKSESTNALHRLIGSQAFGAVARSAFQVGETDQPGIFAIEHVKSNDGPRQPVMRGRIVGTEVDGHSTAQVEWIDEAVDVPTGYFAVPEGAKPKARPRDLARVWALEEVARRGTVSRDELREAIRVAFGFSDGSSLPRQVLAELVRRGALVEAEGLLRTTEQNEDES